MPRTFTVHFVGRKLGAIGVLYPITEAVKAKTPEEAIKKLYDRYEHIRIINITDGRCVCQ
jgi:hypothetical protein